MNFIQVLHLQALTEMLTVFFSASFSGFVVIKLSKLKLKELYVRNVALVCHHT